MPIGFNISERGSGSYSVLAILRWVMALIFLTFGPHKFVPQYQHGITTFLWNSPLVSWLSILGEQGEAYLIGTIELTTGLLLILGSFSPILSAFGSLMGMSTFFLTSSFLFSTPGVATWSFSLDPVVLNITGQFLYLNIVLFCVCLVLFLASLPDNVLPLRRRRPVAM